MSGKFVGTWKKTKEKVEGVTRRLLGRHEVTDVDADGYVTVRMMDEPSGTWYYYRMPQLKHRPIMPGDKALVVKMGGGYVALGAIEHASEDDAFDGDYSISAIYDPDYPTGSSNLELLLARIGQFYFWNGVKARASSVVNGRIVVELEWDKEGDGWGTSHHPARQDHQHPGDGTNSVAVGLNADASGALATAVGNGANATALNATAVGQFSNANEQSATAVGQFSNAVEPSATAVGQAATADGERSFVIGAGGSTNVDDRGVLKANEVVIDRSSGSGGTRIGLRDSSGNIHWIGVTNTNITFDGSPVSGGGGATWGSITGTLSNQTDLQNALDAKVTLNGTEWTIVTGSIENLQDDVSDLQSDLDDKVSKSAGGTQNITGSLQLGGSIGATGAIINGGIFNGDNDDAWPWGALYINSPIITDAYGTPQWDGDTGLEVEHINGLQSALNGKANTSHTHAGSDITSGTIAPARLGTGTPSGSTYLRGDGQWATVPGGLDAEAVRDIIGTALQEGANIDISVDDGADTITISVTGLDIDDISGLQTALNDKVSKSAGGTQSLAGSLQLSGSIGATGAIINGGILNGDNDNTMPWGTFTINSPIITDAFGAPEWEGDTGLDVSKINGLQTALDGKANTSHTHAAGDITSGTFSSARIPNLAASKITSGTLNPARLGSGTAAKNTVLHGDGTWKQLQIGVPVWGSQQWYGPITNGSPWKAETNLNGFPNNHFATWFVPPHDASVDRASIYVSTSGGSGSVARIAIYADNNGEPGARVADFGSVLTDSTGTKTTSAISAVNLTGGTRYWAVVATSGTPVLNGMTAWASLWGSSVNGSALCGITAIRANTNMPTNWNTGDTTFNHQISPRVVFRTT